MLGMYLGIPESRKPPAGWFRGVIPCLEPCLSHQEGWFLVLFELVQWGIRPLWGGGFPTHPKKKKKRQTLGLINTDSLKGSRKGWLIGGHSMSPSLPIAPARSVSGGFVGSLTALGGVPPTSKKYTGGYTGSLHSPIFGRPGGGSGPRPRARDSELLGRRLT